MQIESPHFSDKLFPHMFQMCTGMASGCAVICVQYVTARFLLVRVATGN